MISLEWVKDYIDISDQDLEELAVKITQSGINVEKVITNHINNLVIGEVLECVAHPDSDHLHVCKVNVGNITEQIVCGAPNVREGLKVIVALPGAVLPGDFEIKKSKIRGVESNGMLCALYELGLEEKNDETYAKGIEELGTDAPVGEDPLKYLGLDDTLYELDIHKHRNNDCYYHIGFAYEIGAILNRPVTLPDLSFKEDKNNVENYFTLDVETEKCPFYLAKMVKNVKIGESPEFIKKRLLAAGMRPINNVVDISNYVMLEFGQPLHFFDKNRLGNHILVRDAKDKEEVITLDGKRRILSSNDIVITDGNRPVCIAGVMGGENTEVEQDTTDILIEAAIFDPVSIRYTAANLDLRSEASIRYGKGLSYEYTEMALKRACHLLEKYADATILSGCIRHDVIDKTPKVVEFVPEDVNKLLGITITVDDMKVELKRLGFDYKLVDNKFIVTIPNRRLDIDSNVNDIAEEIVRLYGYQNLVSTIPKVPIKRGEYVGDVKYRKLVSKRLRTLGLNESKTYTLVSPEMTKIFRYRDVENKTLPNPMSVDKSVVRTTLIPSLLNVYEYNKKRKVKDISLYEIAKTYDKDYNEASLIAGLCSGNYLSNGWTKPVKYDFYIVKGIVENVLEYMGFKNRYSFEVSTCTSLHPGISADIFLDRKKIGIIGRVHPNICKDEVYVFEMSLNALMSKIKPLKYKPSPKYPGISKDMAFILDKNTTAGEVMAIIKRAGGRLLDSVSVFDVYTGENIASDKKSIAFTLNFINPERTLTDEEVMEVFNKIILEVTTKLNCELRDK
ncbi:phenylalanyl-tRNA synthetase beta subunit [human gut metagenome]|uniref:Phenylalanine--tRNA ligase beta subunit n=1 Tax=human gut metagenome TaxID=408170 RepID=K1U858_9ZZZZ